MSETPPLHNQLVNLSGAAVVDRDLCLVELDAAFAALAGGSAADLAGTAIGTAFPHLEAPLRALVAGEQPDAHLALCAASEPPVTLRARALRTPRGTVLGVELSVEQAAAPGAGAVERPPFESPSVRAVLDSLFAFAGVLLPDGTLIEANRTALEAAGLVPADVLGRPFEDAYWWSYDREIQAQLRAAIARAAQGESARYDVVVRLAADHFITIDFMLAPAYDDHGRVQYLIPSAIDISERKAVEAALSASERHLSLALSAAQMGTWELDLATQQVHRSPFSDRLFGLVPSEAPRPADDYFSRLHPEDAARVHEAIRRTVDAGAEHVVEYRVVWPDGTVRWLASRGELIRDEQGVPRQLIGAMIDVTERREAVEARDSFIAIASHDLRSPLTAILGQAELLERRAAEVQLPERMARAIRTIADQARRINRMIGALLDLSRIQGGQLTVDLARLDLGALVTRCVEDLRPTLTRHTLDLEGAGAELWVLGDEMRLEQVLLNLLNNAVKYSPHGGAIMVRLERRGGQACVAVEDRGIGIPAEALPRLFERFYRAANAMASGASGLGIGLYAVQAILALHGGTIGVESVEGAGSTFTACLPLAPGEGA